MSLEFGQFPDEIFFNISTIIICEPDQWRKFVRGEQCKHSKLAKPTLT